MSKKRRHYSSAYKFKLSLEAAKGAKTLEQLSSDTGLVRRHHIISQVESTKGALPRLSWTK